MVKQVTRSQSPIQFVPYEEAYGQGFEDMMRRVPDLTRIREAIGYRPTKMLRQIVSAVAESIPSERAEFTATTVMPLAQEAQTDLVS